MFTIGIDIGTTTISAVVMDTTQKKVMHFLTIENNTFIPSESWERIQDPQKIIQKAEGLLEELLRVTPDISGIGLTGQMHGIVYLNKEGEVISPLYTWQDKRGDLPLKGSDACTDSLVSELSKKYCLPVSSGYGLVSHIYNIRHDLVPSDAVTCCTIMDYLGMKLTGRTRPLIHASNAASLGFYNSKSFSFYTDILAEEGISKEFLPEVTLSVEPLGKYHSLPVFTALGDNQASFLGAVGNQPDTWQINVGTGGQISVLAKEPFTTPGIEARPYLDGTWILSGSILCAGRAYAILEHFFRDYASAINVEGAQYHIMEKLALKAEQTNLDPLQVSTKFVGTRVDADIRGEILQIGEQNFTPGNLICGVLHGIVNEFQEIAQPILDNTGMRVEHIIGSGNGLRKNRLLQKYCEDSFCAELTMSPFMEEAASGAALSLAYASGI